MGRGNRIDADLSDVATHRWTASDGVELAYHELGEGAPVLLVHGLFSSAHVNWIKFGHAARIAAEGFRVIMPDLRAHGQSAAPHDPASYPDGILGRDLEDLVAHLRIDDYDLGGFSLGARTVVQAVGEGLKPRRAVLAGMGLEGLSGWLKRKDFFLDAIALADSASHGDPHWLAIQFMKTMKVDRVAAALLLPTFTDAKPEWLAAFSFETIVLAGSEDHDNGSAPGLAGALPDATYVAVPGTHMSSVARQEFGEQLAEFLAAP